MNSGISNKGGLDSPKTILVAEDEDINYLYLKVVLNDAGYNVLHAKNGQEAIDLFKQCPSIDLALIDIKMPVMNGLDATIEIKKLHPDVPVLAQTAYALESEKKAYGEFGFDAYLTKPISKDYLLGVVKKFI